MGDPNYLSVLVGQLSEQAQEDLPLAQTLSAVDLRPVQQRLSRVHGWEWWKDRTWSGFTGR